MTELPTDKQLREWFTSNEYLRDDESIGQMLDVGQVRAMATALLALRATLEAAKGIDLKLDAADLENDRLREENLALRAERAKTKQSDEERAQTTAYQVGVDSFATYPGCGGKHVLSLITAIRAEGSAERVKLEAALRQIESWPDHTRDDLGDTIQRMQQIARDALAQPAESGARE